MVELIHPTTWGWLLRPVKEESIIIHHDQLLRGAFRTDEPLTRGAHAGDGTHTRARKRCLPARVVAVDDGNSEKVTASQGYAVTGVAFIVSLVNIYAFWR